MKELYYISEYNDVRQVSLLKKEDIIGFDIRVFEPETNRTLILSSKEVYSQYKYAKSIAFKRRFLVNIKNLKKSFINFIVDKFDKAISKTLIFLIPSKNTFLKRASFVIETKNDDYNYLIINYKKHRDWRLVQKSLNNEDIQDLGFQSFNYNLNYIFKSRSYTIRQKMHKFLSIL